MQFLKNDRVDLIGPAGFIPEGAYEVISVSGNRVRVRHRETGKEKEVDARELSGFSRPGSIKWP